MVKVKGPAGQEFSEQETKVSFIHSLAVELWKKFLHSALKCAMIASTKNLRGKRKSPSAGNRELVLFHMFITLCDEHSRLQAVLEALT